MMRLLCDTHILLWYLAGDERLSEKARALMDDESNEILFSVVSVWEIAIKHGRKPDKLTVSARAFVKFCEEQGFLEYPLNDRHIFALDTLTRPKNASEHHAPFDRLLLAQAKTDSLIFLTHDALIPQYGENCVLPV